ncbi:hypothetical protein Dsin_028922 [Dipteronia sinensis]|uniref:Uncharacterized protein n=1 Tax=Dipteronia sinensis TaxID=43782 RepID=A0AAD9ZSZ2_9ROSI|nr:hypothetical protein Dsin_028922 [Dipteronia sinensis]
MAKRPRISTFEKGKQSDFSMGVTVSITPVAITQYFATLDVQLFYDPARLLHRLVSGRLIDIGRVIFQDICHCGSDDTLSMVFHCLITAFWRNAGIDVDTGLEEHAPIVIGLTHWNNLLHSRGLPTIGPYKERRRRREAREAQAAQMEDQQLQIDAASPIPGDQPRHVQPDAGQFDSFLQALKKHMDSCLGELEGQMN